jgi:acetyltransferase-like isoleucine patch superfamily enzyme
MIGNILLAFLPSFLQVPIRRLLGQKIGKGSRIRFGTIVRSKSIEIGKGVSIGPFCYVKSEQLIIGDNSVIKPLSITSTRLIKLGKYVHIAPLSIISSEFTENSKLEIGDHSRIFPFCWLDTGEGISIGKQSSVGTHTLIYTHGTWSDYLYGAPIAYGPVIIHDNVWIPTRVTILPNVEIGANSIIGASSLVNKSFPGNTLIGGTPAKAIRENILQALTPDNKLSRALEILQCYSKYIAFKYQIKSTLENNKLLIGKIQIAVDDTNLNKGDLLILLNKEIASQEIDTLINKGISVLEHKNKTIRLLNKELVLTDFISYVRRYGIRLYID